MFESKTPRVRRVVGGVLFLVTGAAWGSTLVGNCLTTRPAAIDGATLGTVVVPVDDVQERACGQSTFVSVPFEWSGGALRFGVPSGTCEVWVPLTDDLDIQAVSSNRPIHLDLAIDGFDLVFGQSYSPASGNEVLVLELGGPGWTSASALLPNGATSADVGPGDPEHDDLVAALVGATAIYVDSNADGVLQSGERNQGAIAATP